jgi:hypothetical protein
MMETVAAPWRAPVGEKALTAARGNGMSLGRVQQRKGGDPMSHAMVARRAGPANEALVTSARIG